MDGYIDNDITTIVFFGLILFVMGIGAFFTRWVRRKVLPFYAGVLPDKIKSFHKKTIVTFAILAVVCFAAGGGAMYMEQNDAGESIIYNILTAIAVGSIIVGIIWLVYRSLFAVPKCPQCNRALKHTRTVEVDKQTWRIVYCENCKKEYRIPGLSTRGD
jgi:uncharacterized protein YbaR (Trm112 family)